MKFTILLLFTAFISTAQVNLFNTEVGVQGNITIHGNIDGTGSINIKDYSTLIAGKVSCNIEVVKELYNKSRYTQECILTYEIFDTTNKFLGTGRTTDGYLDRLPKDKYLILRYSNNTGEKVFMKS